MLLNRLILPLEEKQLIDRKNQQHVELLFLLTARCKFNLTRAIKQVKKHYDEELF